MLVSLSSGLRLTAISTIGSKGLGLGARGAAPPSAVAFVSLKMVQTRSSSRKSGASAGRGLSTGASQQTKEDTWDHVHNFRDLAESLPGLQPGILYRTAAPIRASSQDIKNLYNHRGIKELIDLRSTEELKEGANAPVFMNASFCKYTRDPATKRSVPDATNTVMADSDVWRVQISPLEKETYYWALLRRMPVLTALWVVLLRIINKQEATRAAIHFVNEGGLEMLYDIILDDAAPEMVAALRRISGAAAAGRPVLVFCKAGKDRTGMLFMLCLSLCGASEQQILDDYVKSDAYHAVALAGLEGDPRVTGLDRQTFERAPRPAMEHALRHIKSRWGSVPAYLEAAGFTGAEQQQLREALMGKHSASRGSKM